MYIFCLLFHTHFNHKFCKKPLYVNLPDINNMVYMWGAPTLIKVLTRDAGKGERREGLAPLPFPKGGRGGAKVPFYKVYFINVCMWTEPYHLSIVNHLLLTICGEIVTTAYRILISAL